MFALLLCVAAGVKPIITSGSDDKLKAIQKYGGETGVLRINYKTCQDIPAEVMRLTNGLGVDIVINNSGVSSIPQDIAALRQRNGVISLVGFLGGLEADWSPTELMGLMKKCGRIQYVQTSIYCVLPLLTSILLKRYHCWQQSRSGKSRPVCWREEDLPGAVDRSRFSV
jgi:NADPH:quinone reductase-like Zn-dependent oxidoreductase